MTPEQLESILTLACENLPEGYKLTDGLTIGDGECCPIGAVGLMEGHSYGDTFGYIADCMGLNTFDAARFVNGFDNDLAEDPSDPFYQLGQSFRKKYLKA